MKTKLLFSVAAPVIIITFGLTTLFISSSILFDWFDIKTKEGYFVLFFVLINFICSILYLTASYGLIKKKQWTIKLLLAALILLSIAFVCLINHIIMGSPYEANTVGTIIFRIGITVGFIVIAKKISK